MTQLKVSDKHQLFTLVDDADAALVEGLRFRVMFLRKKKPYVYIALGRNKVVALARFLMKPPAGMVVDHISGNTLDNRRENLRICTYAQNSMNREPHGDASKYRGVTWGARQKKWRASIQLSGKQTHLGYFGEEAAAARAYDALARKLYGEYARLNFP